MTRQHPSNDNADGFRSVRSGRAPAYRCTVCGDVHNGRTIAWRCHCGNVRLVSGFYIARFGGHTVRPIYERGHSRNVSPHALSVHFNSPEVLQ